MKTISGELYGFFETGTEGTIWTVIQDGLQGYESIVDIKENDHLKIYDGDDILFDGVINPDYNVGWTEYPLNPGHGQPAALGYWIHWTQAGFQPDDWAAFFFRKSPLRAELIREEK